MSTRRNEGLCVGVVGGQLTISIGIDALARAIEASPDDRISTYNDAGNDFEHPRIEEPDIFAEEMVRALQDEKEDGTTRVHRLLDDAAVKAFDDGAQGVVFPDSWGNS